MSDDTPLECTDCGLRYGVLWNLDAIGGWNGGFCPRCGCDEIITYIDIEEEEMES